MDRCTDIVKLAEAFCVTDFNIIKYEEVEGILKKAMNINGLVVINCKISRDEKVLPILPPGEEIKNLIID